MGRLGEKKREMLCQDVKGLGARYKRMTNLTLQRAACSLCRRPSRHLPSVSLLLRRSWSSLDFASWSLSTPSGDELELELEHRDRCMSTVYCPVKRATKIGEGNTTAAGYARNSNQMEMSNNNRCGIQQVRHLHDRRKCTSRKIETKNVPMY